MSIHGEVDSVDNLSLFDIHYKVLRLGEFYDIRWIIISTQRLLYGIQHSLLAVVVMTKLMIR